MNYAAMLVILSLLISIACASEGPVSIIDQAQALALKKNRQEAARILTGAIELSPAKARPKLVEALHAIGRVFFTDKGQRLYEAGQASIYETPDLALNQFREALAIEDGNIQIQNNIARVQIFKQDCAGAMATIKAARTLDSLSGESALLELRALVCLKNFEDFRLMLKALPPIDKNQEAYVQYFSAQDSLQQELWHRAHDALVKVRDEQPRFPEVYYLLLKVSHGLEEDGESFAQKYVSLCKGLGARERRQFSYEPRLCLNLKEVEDELAKKNSEL